MIAVESVHIINPSRGGRRPLQPKNIIHSQPKPTKTNHVPSNQSDKNNIQLDRNPIPIDPPMDASLAEELNAVKKKLERLRLDRDKTDKMLMDRVRILDTQMSEVMVRGEFQKELEIEVDRLYRLKQLHLASLRRSPIRSLRDKQMEKRNKEPHSGKTEESKEGSSGQTSSIGSIGSNSDNTSGSTWTWTSSSTKNSPIPFRWSSENESEK